LLFPGIGPGGYSTWLGLFATVAADSRNESATRLIAGCFRFFTFTQSGQRPPRQQPSEQARKAITPTIAVFHYPENEKDSVGYP
jgi:hypothetical protein